jgi:hypothetical protein
VLLILLYRSWSQSLSQRSNPQVSSQSLKHFYVASIESLLIPILYPSIDDIWTSLSTIYPPVQVKKPFRKRTCLSVCTGCKFPRWSFGISARIFYTGTKCSRTSGPWAMNRFKNHHAWVHETWEQCTGASPICIRSKYSNLKTSALNNILKINVSQTLP